MRARPPSIHSCLPLPPLPPPRPHAHPPPSCVPGGVGQAGACITRTRDLTDPTGWRAWNGSAFSVTLWQSPYANPDLNPALQRCAPFTNDTYITLAWSSVFQVGCWPGREAGGGG
jgi:hypothetical protein